MHINMKYYIVSIGAIFIALGIGMLVGFNLNYDEELSKQQTAVINDLDQKFEGLREVNDTLEENLTNLTTEYENNIGFINKNADKLLIDTLQGKYIGIISANQNDVYAKEIENIITKSSGNVAFNITLTENIKNEEKLSEVSQSLGKDFKNSEELIKYIISSLKDENGKNQLHTLENLEVLNINQISDEYINAESVVLTGGSESKNQREEFEGIYNSVISNVKENNINIVGVQKSNSKISYTDLYVKNKIANIDNIDEGIGQIALSILLNDNKIVDNFGRLDSANFLLPQNK